MERESDGGFLFERSMADHYVLSMWMSYPAFTNEIHKLVMQWKEIDDASILQSMKNVLKNASKQILNKKRATQQINEYERSLTRVYFDKAWFCSCYPHVWESIRNASVNKKIINPVQMCRYVKFVKIISNTKDGNIKVKAHTFDENTCVAYIEISITKIDLKNNIKNYLYLILKTCSRMIIENQNSEAIIKLFFNNFMTPIQEYIDEEIQKKAWTLHWNENYIYKDKPMPHFGELYNIEEC